MYQYVLFDLDGTLTDPGEGITNSVMYALRHFGIEETDREKLFSFIGPPLVDSFMEKYGFSEEDAREATRLFRVYFQERGIFENVPYEGMIECLNELKERGHILAVATSKPEVFARRILERFGFLPCFDYVFGASMDETRTRKDEVIAYALEEMGVTDRSACVMVGDRSHDMIGARKNGLDAIGVLFGYGSREELEEAGARYIAETVGDLPRILALTTVHE
ncbi:MAG: HAD family hydrolase [Lachnospiraceae bacterium]|nr:HAD family hydrolase [Lachnospiraceae bacterium]